MQEVPRFAGLVSQRNSIFITTTCACCSCIVGVFAQVEDLYYHKFTQGVLWPLFHCIPTNFNEALLENFQSQYEVRAITVLGLGGEGFPVVWWLTPKGEKTPRDSDLRRRHLLADLFRLHPRCILDLSRRRSVHLYCSLMLHRAVWYSSIRHICPVRNK